PAEALQRFQSVRADGPASDTTMLGAGAPDDFVPNVLAAIDALNLLETGRAQYGPAGWSFNGRAGSEPDPDAALAALEAGGAPWQAQVTAPPPPLPVISPYVWVAAKSDNGTFAFAGFVPTPQFKRFQAVRADGEAAD